MPCSRATLWPVSVWTTAGLIADGTFDDPANARVIYLAVAGLVLLAVLLGVGTWLWWRSSKVENPVLAPLEVMGTQRWWKSDFNERQRRLDAVRPELADANHEADVVGAVPSAEPVDLNHVLVREDPHTFDDLVDPDAGSQPTVVPVVESEPVLERDPESAGSEPAVAESIVPEPVVEPEPAVSVPVARSIVIDTAPKPRDTPPDLGPEAADSDPTPAPIDPLLRLQAE